MSFKVYKTEDLIELLDITRQTVYKNIKEGKLEGTKVANKWIFTEQQVKDYLEGKNK